MAKPVLINVNFCKPLPDGQRGCHCASCGKQQAKWLFGNPPNTICSTCLLYKSFWGKNRSLEIAELVVEVEKKLGKPFLRDTDGNLLSEVDATRIAGSILYSSHVVAAAMRSHLRRSAVQSMVGDEDVGDEEEGQGGDEGQDGPEEALEAPQDAQDDGSKGQPS